LGFASGIKETFFYAEETSGKEDITFLYVTFQEPGISTWCKLIALVLYISILQSDELQMQTMQEYIYRSHIEMTVESKISYLSTVQSTSPLPSRYGPRLRSLAVPKSCSFTPYESLLSCLHYFHSPSDHSVPAQSSHSSRQRQSLPPSARRIRLPRSTLYQQVASGLSMVAVSAPLGKLSW